MNDIDRSCSTVTVAQDDVILVLLYMYDFEVFVNCFVWKRNTYAMTTISLITRNASESYAPPPHVASFCIEKSADVSTVLFSCTVLVQYIQNMLYQVHAR